MTAATKSRARNRIRIAVFVLIQVALALLVLEGSLRLLRGSVPQLGALLHLEQVSGRFNDSGSTEELLGQSALGYRPGRAAGGYRLNLRGFATAEYTSAPVPGERRIVVLGDSFVFNDFPHEWMWHTLLQNELSEDLGKVRVVSLGVPATSPDFYLRLWQLEGALTKADVVVVGITIGNDITDDAAAPLERRRRSPLLRHSLAARGLRNALVLARYSLSQANDRGHSASAGEPRKSRVEAPNAVPPGSPLRRYAEQFNEDRPSLSRTDYRDLMWKRTVVSRVAREDDLAKWLDRLRPVLAEIHSAITESGAACVFVLFPDEYQVDETLLSSLIAERAYRPEDIKVARPQQRLRRFFERQSLEYVDLLPAFIAAAGDGVSLYRPRDSHWNRAGNELAARQLAGAVRKHLDAVAKPGQSGDTR